MQAFGNFWWAMTFLTPVINKIQVGKYLLKLELFLH